MVVSRRLFLLCVTGLTVAWTSAAAEAVGDPRNGRVALVLENGADDPVADSLLEAAATAIVTVPDIYWFDLPEFDFDAAREVQAEVIGRLRVEGPESPVAPAETGGASGGTSDQGPADSGIPLRPRPFTLTLQFYRVPHRRSTDGTPVLLGEVSLPVVLDRGGRYQRGETWQPFVDTVGTIAAAARPVATVTIESTVPVTLEGLPPWLLGEVDPGPATRFELELRTLRQYEFVAVAPGYRSESRTFYLEYDAFTIGLAPRKYPRHSIAFMPRGASWPGVEYGWYDRRTRWIIHGNLTTFAWGLTPLQQLKGPPDGDERPDRSAAIISSIPLHEVEIGAGRLLRDRERTGRLLVSAGGVLRLTNLDDRWSLEPVMPSALRLGIGWEQELPWRLILSQRLATDLFWPVRAEFLRTPSWSYHLGPILWQLPIYRIGVRVVL